ncbi:MAG: T9SS type A sorting domain-containing protein [Bacteroidia bacterium]|nr:T9SS type A sorting domain-containing protein [Bacteroidia bacterium]
MKKMCYLLFFIAITQIVISQNIVRQSISCLGSSNAGNGFSLQQTIGQSSNTTTFCNESSALRQGFLQPLSLSADINGFDRIGIDFSVYPNPFQNNFTLSFRNGDNRTFILIVTDVLGKIILSSKITENTGHIINTGNWNNGFYFVKLYYGKQLQAVKKIIRT